MAADKKTYIVEYDLRSKTDGATKATKATAGLRRETDKLGDSFEDVAKDAKTLDEKLEIYTRHRTELARRLAVEDDANLRKEFNRTNQRIGFLTKLQKVLSAGTDAGGGAAKATPGIGDMLPKGAPAMIGLGAPAVAALAPGIGALLSGALSGTVVGAAMAAGIAASAHDDRVKASAREFGNVVKDEFFAAGDAFVDPVRRSLDGLKDDVKGLDLAGTLGKAAPYVETVADGLGGMVRNIMPGFNKLLDRAGPYAEVFADGLKDMGTAISGLLDNVSASEGAVEGLQSGFMLLNGTITTVGTTLRVLSDVYHELLEANAAFYGALEDVPGLGSLGKINDLFEHILGSGELATVGVATFGDAAGDSAAKTQAMADALKAMNDEINEYFGTGGRVDDALIAQKKAALEFSMAIKENGKDWRDTTEAGLDNQTKLRDWVKAAQDTRDAQVQAAGANKEAVEKANAEYDKAIEKIKAAGRAAGISEAQLEDLAGEYKISVIVQQKVQTIGAAAGQAVQLALQNVSKNNKPREYASGGTTPANEVFKVHKDELVWSDRQHYVSTKAQTEQLARMSSSGGGTVQLQVMGGAGDRLTELIVYIIQNYVRVNGGNAATLGIVR